MQEINMRLENVILKTDLDILARYINGTLEEAGLGYHHVEEVLTRLAAESVVHPVKKVGA